MSNRMSKAADDSLAVELLKRQHQHAAALTNAFYRFYLPPSPKMLFYRWFQHLHICMFCLSQSPFHNSFFFLFWAYHYKPRSYVQLNITPSPLLLSLPYRSNHNFDGVEGQFTAFKMTRTLVLHPQSYVGLAVQRKFTENNRIYKGIIQEYYDHKQWWVVKYEDGDEEDWSVAQMWGEEAPDLRGA